MDPIFCMGWYVFGMGHPTVWDMCGTVPRDGIAVGYAMDLQQHVPATAILVIIVVIICCCRPVRSHNYPTQLSHTVEVSVWDLCNGVI